MPATKALPPGSTIGILGGGQLGRMLALAAARLGFRCHVFSPDPVSPAFDVAAKSTVADYGDQSVLAGFGRGVDVVTYEFENVDVAAVERLSGIVPVRPGAKALAISQDRFSEKTFLRDLGVATAAFADVSDRLSLDRAIGALGLPAVLKTRRLGYDGKGQHVIRWADEAGAAFEKMRGAPAILERFVNFSREISIIAVRGTDGKVAFYDPAENVHRNGILHTSTVPARVSEKTAIEAGAIATRILSALDYIGVIGVELFVAGENGAERLLVNEIAPRVHNSGHWTEDACAVSQFENHIRAIAGWPLAQTARHSDVVMTNLIGREAEDWARLAAEPDLRLHLYGKREARPGRKMGHVNRLTAQRPETVAVSGAGAGAVALEHVQLAMPEGGEAKARAFYAGLLGIPEIEKPENLKARGGCWFQSGELRLHLGVESDFRPARKAHPALIVGDLAALSAALAAAGHSVRSDAPFGGFTRVHVDDPFGNRIELMQPDGANVARKPCHPE
jgi:5-(carboxyamino)imidazole ribonucleotide synthase